MEHYLTLVQDLTFSPLSTLNDSGLQIDQSLNILDTDEDDDDDGGDSEQAPQAALAEQHLSTHCYCILFCHSIFGK